MKNLKSIAVIAAIIFISTLITNCNNDDNSYENNLNSNFINKLENFNSNYLETSIGKHKTIGSIANNNLSGKVACSDCWGGFLDFLTVAGADIVGAGAGAVAVKEIAAGVGIATGGTGAAVVVGGAAVIAGAGASVAASNELTKKQTGLKISSKPFIKSLNINYPIEFMHLAECGKEHNIRVHNLKLNKITQSKTFSENDEIFNSKEWKEVMDKIEREVQFYKDKSQINQLLSSFENESLITENMSVVLGLFFDIYNKSENNHNIEDITNFYIHSIADEETLSYQEKEALISSFSVATESPYYWANQN